MYCRHVSLREHHKLVQTWSPLANDASLLKDNYGYKVHDIADMHTIATNKIPFTALKVVRATTIALDEIATSHTTFTPLKILSSKEDLSGTLCGAAVVEIL
ncbi:hypothetical protein G6011_10089 [Alternaria panax]|uniref:Uncharacterized protein n=1 Tax=Alternaria panax TaxID=48097 RepID=A0AAD4FCB0_9PLEO|nr:hypothetical protein G6011_10089 [Alternaria panax]